jgi:putative transposase
MAATTVAYPHVLDPKTMLRRIHLPTLYAQDMRYHSRMKNKLVRYQQTGHLHFITFSCYRRQPYFASRKGRELFERSLETMRLRHGFCVLGYVVMPEHIHLLVTEPKLAILAKAIQALKISVSRQSIQRPFWQARYYDFNLFTARKLSEKLRYMHRNPVKRGLVSEPVDWPWSSFRHYLTGEQGPVEIESHWTVTRRERAATTTQVSKARPGAPAWEAL